MNESGGVFAPAHRALTIGILLTITAAACEGMAAATIMPSVASELGGLDGYGWAFSLFMLASLVGAIGAGQVADRRNPALPARAGFACFAFGWIGGGDAKLAAVTSLWLGFGNLLDYFFIASIGGGLLTLLVLVARSAPLPAATST